MTLVELVSNKIGLGFDCLLVRVTGYSLITWVYNRAAGIGYIHSLLLTTTGARTGRSRRAVLPYFMDGDRYVIVGSNGGGPNDPHWTTNLRAHPDVEICVERRPQMARAEVASGEQRERLWQAITKGRGPYAYYQKQAKPREIPVVVLIPTHAGASAEISS